MPRAVALALLALLPPALPAQPLPKSVAGFDAAAEMVPMRDGVKLYTTVFTPKARKGPLPILIVRTPYGIDNAGRQLLGSLKELADDGYAFAFQDVRGRYHSDGTFVMLRPARDPKDPKAVDEASDTADTIDWLLKTVPGNNGRVGILGISYPGWLAAVAAIDPHPALKASSPQAPPADMFLGDDFHHNGAFRLSYGFEYAALLETGKTNFTFQFDAHDTYDWYRKLGPLSNANRLHFKGKLPTWENFVDHPNYDAFWKAQSLEPRLTAVKVPTLNVGGWYDQEDLRGPQAIYRRLEKHDAQARNFLVMGPWNHSGWAGKFSTLGRLDFGSDTGGHFRAKIQAPFFAKYLKNAKADIPEAQMFQTGANAWKSYEQWPPKGATAKKLYFGANGKLGWEPPTAEKDAFDEYLSDPAKPVPYRPRPVRPTYPGPEWPTWMAQDQRFTDGRPDVLTFQTDPLTEDVDLAGAMSATLFAATTGTDADWVVRLIDVHPEGAEAKPADLAGFQQLLAGEPLRGRFRNGFEKPEAVKPAAVEEYVIDLNWGHHRFRKGHRIMVQVSSSWFPLYDRNPQTFVPNIFKAEEKDFVAATQRVYRTVKQPSHLSLAVLPAK